MRNISAGIGGQVGHLTVNGPADDALCWDAIDWRSHEDNVRRLRQRIFTAARDRDLGTLRNLQKLMLRSWSNTLLSVRQATQRNAGRKTAGVDGEVALTPQARAELAVQLHRELKSGLAPTLTITDIYRFPTVAGLAAHVTNRGNAKAQFAHVADRAATRRGAIAARSGRRLN